MGLRCLFYCVNDYILVKWLVNFACSQVLSAVRVHCVNGGVYDYQTDSPFVYINHLQPNDFQLLQQLGMSEDDQLKLALELSIQGMVCQAAALL